MDVPFDSRAVNAASWMNFAHIFGDSIGEVMRTDCVELSFKASQQPVFFMSAQSIKQIVREEWKYSMDR